MKSEPVLDVETVAKLTGYNPQTIRRHIRNGNLRATRSTAYIIDPDDLKAFLRKLPVLSKAGRPKNVATVVE
jgi:hypothetical protein